MTQNLWDAAKAVLTRKFIAIQSHLKKQEKSQVNNLTLHLKQLEKEEQRKLKVSRRKEIIKVKDDYMSLKCLLLSVLLNIHIYLYFSYTNCLFMIFAFFKLWN